MGFFRRLKRLSKQRNSYGLLALGCATLLAYALLLEYRHGLQPCVLCVYQRAAVTGIGLAALVAMLAPRWALLRVTMLTAALASSLWGLQLAYKHVLIQQGALIGDCAYVTQFPAWLPLDRWLPRVFSAGGDCALIDWQWLGFSLPQWLAVVFFVIAVILLLVLVAQTARLRTNPYE